MLRDKNKKMEEVAPGKKTQHYRECSTCVVRKTITACWEAKSLPISCKFSTVQWLHDATILPILQTCKLVQFCNSLCQNLACKFCKKLSAILAKFATCQLCKRKILQDRANLATLHEIPNKVARKCNQTCLPRILLANTQWCFQFISNASPRQSLCISSICSHLIRTACFASQFVSSN